MAPQSTTPLPTTPAPPDVPTPSTTTLPAADRTGYAKLTHRLSWWLVFACPAIALLPPRKLDLYTMGLGAMTAVSAEHLARERSGGTVLQRLGRGLDVDGEGAAGAAEGGAGAGWGSEFPTERARLVHEVQKRAREERERALRAQGAAAAAAAAAQEGEAKEDKGLLRKVWMGGETEGWKERRLKEEREAIEEGRGYGGLIMDQIWEVWNGGKKNAEKVDERDLREEVLKRTEAEKKS